MKTKNKRIDIVIAQLAEKGGLDRVLNDVIPFLQKNGYYIRLIQLVDYGLDWLVDGIENYSISDVANAGSFRDAAEGYARFLEKCGRPDMILAAGWPVVTTIVRLALDNLGVDDVVLLAWPHMRLYEGLVKGVGGAGCMADADAVLAISREIRKETLEVIPNHCVLSIKNPLDLNHLNYHEDSRNKNVLAFVGRLVEYKNIKLVFEAISKSCEEYRLIVAGDGEMEKTQKLCHEYGLENRVEFLGWVDKPWEKLKNAGWLVVSSDYEGFSLVIVEALATGMPVISTPVGIAPEVIVPGKNGYLYPIKDSDGLAAILNYISEGILPELDSKVCRESVLQYDKENVLKDFCQQLKNVFDAVFG